MTAQLEAGDIAVIPFNLNFSTLTGRKKTFVVGCHAPRSVNGKVTSILLSREILYHCLRRLNWNEFLIHRWWKSSRLHHANACNDLLLVHTHQSEIVAFFSPLFTATNLHRRGEKWIWLEVTWRWRDRAWSRRDAGFTNACGKCKHASKAGDWPRLHLLVYALSSICGVTMRSGMCERRGW